MHLSCPAPLLGLGQECYSTSSRSGSIDTGRNGFDFGFVCMSRVGWLIVLSSRLVRVYWEIAERSSTGGIGAVEPPVSET
jgi:hypothetical protein